MKKIISGILIVLAIILLVFALIALIFAIEDFIFPGGFTDAAPYWVFFFMAACILGIPGLILLYVSKKISMTSVSSISSEESQQIF
jgi:hypothetical protein